MIDTHAHLYSKKFESDRSEMIERAVAQGVEQFYLPNIDSSSIEGMLELESTYPNRCFAMMGLHPCSVQENYEEELAIVRSWLDKRSFCAIGEIGIDLYWDKSTLPIQEKAFKTQIDWALEFDVPIVIHARESTEEILAILETIEDERLRGIFHCFTGDAGQAQRAIDLGFHLGIGGVLTFKNAGLDKTIADIDLKHLVLETDAPYLAPVPKRGKRNESAYVYFVAEKLSEIKSISLEEIAKVTTANAEKIFAQKPQRQVLSN
ncbi:hydrolase TatD [Flavilitoribacter nigricans DSM 23189 = NBRC 102662]|uniref:Hydrolase TatD n=1 Tax=Flavilitoribacter nigricans (strain ATCC 23147 / DSM 23189 / NBRC 102662 / NCIMB 1420 / SS-2) TaxID=1122177 RepID=A0A2D0N0W0_FLAN2|nr:hydrolase TatD [Flavilitoribacter nigricans DSM 23189 = NBRC 102662]